MTTGALVTTGPGSLEMAPTRCRMWASWLAWQLTSLTLICLEILLAYWAHQRWSTGPIFAAFFSLPGVGEVASTCKSASSACALKAALDAVSSPLRGESSVFMCLQSGESAVMCSCHLWNHIPRESCDTFVGVLWPLFGFLETLSELRLGRLLVVALGRRITPRLWSSLKWVVAWFAMRRRLMEMRVVTSKEVDGVLNVVGEMVLVADGATYRPAFYVVNPKSDTRFLVVGAPQGGWKDAKDALNEANPGFRREVATGVSFEESIRSVSPDQLLVFGPEGKDFVGNGIRLPVAGRGDFLVMAMHQWEVLENFPSFAACVDGRTMVSLMPSDFRLVAGSPSSELDFAVLLPKSPAFFSVVGLRAGRLAVHTFGPVTVQTWSPIGVRASHGTFTPNASEVGWAHTASTTRGTSSAPLRARDGALRAMHVGGGGESRLNYAIPLSLILHILHPVKSVVRESDRSDASGLIIEDNRNDEVDEERRRSAYAGRVWIAKDLQNRDGEALASDAVPDDAELEEVLWNDDRVDVGPITDWADYQHELDQDRLAQLRQAKAERRRKTQPSDYTPGNTGVRALDMKPVVREVAPAPDVPAEAGKSSAVEPPTLRSGPEVPKAEPPVERAQPSAAPSVPGPSTVSAESGLATGMLGATQAKPALASTPMGPTSSGPSLATVAEPKSAVKASKSSKRRKKLGELNRQLQDLRGQIAALTPSGGA